MFQTPLSLWTLSTATAIVPVSMLAASGVRAPMANRVPPTVSLSPAAVACTLPGLSPIPSKPCYAGVAAAPWRSTTRSTMSPMILETSKSLGV